MSFEVSAAYHRRVQVPTGFRMRREGVDRALVEADLGDLPLASWWRQGQPLAAAAGRAGVQLLDVAPGCRAAVRDYRRGGVLRRLLHDRFFGFRRAADELAAHVELRARGVSVVEPLAAVGRRRGLVWRLRLATRLVEAALPLPAFLAAHPSLRRAALQRAGAVVARAFAAGLRHPDLHPENLLVQASGDGVEVLLLDLDRATLGAPVTSGERDAMLLRMARYVERHASRLSMQRSDRLRFLQGMNLAAAERRRELQRLESAYERAVVRHRWSWRAARGS